MHIPDGFLSTPVWLGLDAVSLPAVGFVARRAQRAFDDSRSPLLGVMGAFVFAAQMINFPVGGGASGHLVGGTLLAVTLGPAAAAVVMTAILAVQALVFQDGGILALGANVLNMALAGVAVGWLPYHLWGARHRRAATFAGAAASVFTSAALMLAELSLSGLPIPRGLAALSLGLFAITALIEGALTVAVVGGVERLSPTLIVHPSPQRRYALAALAGTALAIATAGVLFASAFPDGLMHLAHQAGIAERARNLVASPLAGYEAGFASGLWARKAAAGLAGLALVFGVLMAAQRAMARRGSA